MRQKPYCVPAHRLIKNSVVTVSMPLAHAMCIRIVFSEIGGGARGDIAIVHEKCLTPRRNGCGGHHISSKYRISSTIREVFLRTILYFLKLGGCDIWQLATIIWELDKRRRHSKLHFLTRL
ncbi:unnamed protein product [Acanthoscelides obtectus]|uniref:Uncharacterized protein n=1 Tax=Acanthoscelides obtectus TaxID=200917 RepID=A0A9P0K7T8_ACAOB|nr:unnamed protein product [Acanthoscelides obtectus]CAK1631181.1 hypothetical protein AOBTE_LOCUS6798 [Acanthoscelides obtectus]